MKQDNKQVTDTKTAALNWFISLDREYKRGMVDMYISRYVDISSATPEQIEYMYLCEHPDKQPLSENPQPTDTGKEDVQQKLRQSFANMAKKDTGNTVSSEVGFTGGKWRYRNILDERFEISTDTSNGQNSNGYIGSIEAVLYTVPNQAEANAQRIVQAVNNHDKLVSALKDARKLLQLTNIIHKSVECGKVAENITELLNNIKVTK